MTKDELINKVFIAFQKQAGNGLATIAILKQMDIGAYNPATQAQTRTPTEQTVYVLYFNKIVAGGGAARFVKDFFPEINTVTDELVLISSNGNIINKADQIFINSVEHYFVKGPKEVSINTNALYAAVISNKQVHNG